MFLGISRDGNELVGTLGGLIVGGFEVREGSFEGEASKRVEKAEAGVFEIIVFEAPVVLGRDVAIAEVESGSFFDGFSFSASDGDNKVVIREVEMVEIALTKRA